MKKILVVGRSSTADFTLVDADETVSRQHLQITDAGESFIYIKDLGSANGTYLQETRLTPHKQYKVQREAEIRLGDSYLFHYPTQLKVFSALAVPSAESETQTVTANAPDKEQKTHILGRSSTADIIILDPQNRISRKHLEIKELDQGGLLIKDLNSTNGTWINGRRMSAEEEQLIFGSEKIILGDGYPLDLGLYFTLDNSTNASPAPEKEGETTVFVTRDKRIALDPNRTTLGELAGLTDAGFRTVGRDKTNDIVVNNSSVSRQHLKIRQLTPLFFELIDLNSSNKTYLDDHPVAGLTSVKFPSSTRIRLGGDYEFDLKKHFSNVEYPPHSGRHPEHEVVLYDYPKLADLRTIREFNELHKVWNEYEKRKKEILHANDNEGVVRASTEILAVAVETWGGFVPVAGPLLVAGGWLIGRWLTKKKKVQLSDDLNFNEIFMETYCCPNCDKFFGFVSWASLDGCKRCQLQFR